LVKSILLGISFRTREKGFPTNLMVTESETKSTMPRESLSLRYDSFAVT